MGSSMFRAAAWTWFIAAWVTIFGNSATVQAAEVTKQDYPETIAVLQLLHTSEIRAGHRYKVYANVAADEGYANIAHMLTAMAASEDLHAFHFERILTSLGVEASGADMGEIELSGTKENLKYATEVELTEIDKDYPRYLKRIAAEHHAEAVEFITYAWQAEKQHRALIKEIRSGTGIFFSKLLDYFRTNPSRYYVNQICGSTVTRLPEDVCPICHNPVDTYLEIPKP